MKQCDWNPAAMQPGPSGSSLGVGRVCTARAGTKQLSHGRNAAHAGRCCLRPRAVSELGNGEQRYVVSLPPFL